MTALFRTDCVAHLAVLFLSSGMSLAPDVDFVSELGNSVKEISRR